MVDIENQIVNRLIDTMDLNHPGVEVKADYIDENIPLPAVAVIDLGIQSDRFTLNNEEYSTRVSYQIDTYTSGVNKKQDAKAIAKSIDEAMILMGFNREELRPVENFSNPQIYRMVGRYYAIVDKHYNIHRR